MRIDILTLSPEIFIGFLTSGTIKRALDAGLVAINIHNIRHFSHNKHHTVDDYPYGGGGGMLMMAEPIFEAVEKVITSINVESKVPIILLSPQGRLLNNEIADRLAKEDNLILICGQYEGIDERVSQYLATEEVSIGDYVLSGGELASMVLINAVTRLIPGVLGSTVSLQNDSYVEGLLEYPQYTRPADFRGLKVPEVLLSGNHAEITRWRHEQSIQRTAQRRPDLLAKYNLSREDKRLLQRLKEEESLDLKDET